jgi:hypothetical protein
MVSLLCGYRLRQSGPYRHDERSGFRRECQRPVNLKIGGDLGGTDFLIDRLVGCFTVPDKRPRGGWPELQGGDRKHRENESDPGGILNRAAAKVRARRESKRKGRGLVGAAGKLSERRRGGIGPGVHRSSRRISRANTGGRGGLLGADRESGSTLEAETAGVGVTERRQSRKDEAADGRKASAIRA